MQHFFRLAAWALLLLSTLLYAVALRRPRPLFDVPNEFLGLLWLPAAGALLGRGLRSAGADDRAWWSAPLAVAVTHMLTFGVWAGYRGGVSDAEVLLAGLWFNTFVLSVLGLALDRTPEPEPADGD